MLKNTLDALAARNVPLQAIVLAGGAKSSWLQSRASTLQRRRQSHVSLRRSTTTSKKTLWLNGRLRTVLAGRSCVPIYHLGPSLKLANEPGHHLATYAAMTRGTRVALALSCTKRDGTLPRDDGRRIVRPRDFVGFRKDKARIKSLTYRTEMSIAGGNCGVSSRLL